MQSTSYQIPYPTYELGTQKGDMASSGPEHTQPIVPQPILAPALGLQPLPSVFSRQAVIETPLHVLQRLLD